MIEYAVATVHGVDLPRGTWTVTNGRGLNPSQGTSLQNVLDQAAQQGWELVSVAGWSDTAASGPPIEVARLFFKREQQALTAQPWMMRGGEVIQ